MVYLLTAFGHETLEAHDGTEGVERASRETPDLILLDIHMPRMDGFEVVRLLRKKPECMAIPIVAVTALAMVGDRERILSSGFCGYIAKPLDPQTFPAQVQGYLGVAHQAAPLPATQWAQQEALARPSAPNKHIVILFVDNMQANIDLVRSVLEPSGYELIAALSVKEGLDMAHRRKPDLIISDIHMPDQSGYNFRRALQADPYLSKTPFTFLSSSVASIREQREALKFGVTKFLSRPIEPQALLSEIERLLQQGKGA
jgi:CheY-like chemotaxis protein